MAADSYTTEQIVALLKEAEIEQCVGDPMPGWCIATGKCKCFAIAGAAKLLSGLAGPASPDSIAMPKAWIEAAKCPSCDGVGWRAIQVEAGVFEQEQCEWCYERWLNLSPSPATGEGHK